MSSSHQNPAADSKSTNLSAMELFSLGRRCLYGLNVPEDAHKAYEYFKQAKAKENDSNGKIANYVEAFEYEWGVGKARNDQKALEFYQKSAEQGLAGAQFSAGNQYFFGRNVSVAKDEKKAVEYYRKAVGQGCAVAQLNLAYAYQCGLGIEVNIVQALMYLRLASIQGLKTANANLRSNLKRADLIADEEFPDRSSLIKYNALMALPDVDRYSIFADISRKNPTMLYELWNNDTQSPHAAIVESAYSTMREIISGFDDVSKVKVIQQIKADLGLKKMEEIEEANHFEEAKKLFSHLNPINLSIDQNFEIGQYLERPNKDRLYEWHEESYRFLREAAIAGHEEAKKKIAMVAFSTSTLGSGIGVDKNEEYLKNMVEWPTTFKIFCDEVKKLVETAKDSKGELSELGSLNPKESKSAPVSTKPRLMVINKNKIEELQKEAASGSGTAKFRLGLTYTWGIGVIPDEKLGFNWTLQAANQGHCDAQYNLGIMYQNAIGVDEDLKASVDWLQAAANQKNIEAQYRLGIAYQSGTGIPKNEKAAFEWYQEAAKQEHIYAQLQLGRCYEHGNGIEKNAMLAVEWYRKSSDQGCSIARFWLATAYRKGEGVAQDREIYIELLQKAAYQGYPVAQALLGNLYAKGMYGWPKDERAAIEWCRKAAEQGNPCGQYSLAIQFQAGLSVAKDEKTAAEYYRLAYMQNFKQAEVDLKSLKEANEKSPHPDLAIKYYTAMCLSAESKENPVDILKEIGEKNPDVLHALWKKDNENHSLNTQLQFQYDAIRDAIYPVMQNVMNHFKENDKEGIRKIKADLARVSRPVAQRANPYRLWRAAPAPGRNAGEAAAPPPPNSSHP